MGTPELLKSLEGLHQQVKQWLMSSMGSQVNRPRRECSVPWRPHGLMDISNSCAMELRPQAQIQVSKPTRTDNSGLEALFGGAATGSSDTCHNSTEHEPRDGEGKTDYGGFLCSARGKLLDANAEESDDSDSGGATGSSDHPSASSYSAEQRSDWRLAHQYLLPEMTAPTTVAVAACSSTLMLAKPVSQWVMREVADSLVNDKGTIMLVPTWPSCFGQGVASASGALTGAALASPMGPLAAIFGGISGALCGNSSQRWLASRPQIHNLASDHGYVMSHSALTGKTYLAHKELTRWPGMNGLMSTALASASIQACSNLWAYANGEISARDVALCFLKDVRDGATVWLTVKGFVTALTVGELRASGLLSSACSMALHYPVPMTFGMLGCAFVTVRCINYTMNRTTLNSLQSNLVLMSASNAMGISVSLASNVLGVPALGALCLTCVSSYAAGVCAHEVWRSTQQRSAQERLRCHARELLGLPHGFTADMLRRRWRTLARLSHPDRNRQKDAHKTFTLFQLCRDVLEEELHHPERDSGRLRGLLRYLRRACWLEQSNLPPTDLLPKPEPKGCPRRPKATGLINERDAAGHAASAEIEL